MEWILIKTLLSLAAVIGLMVGLVFLLRKFLVLGGRPSSTDVDIRVLGTRTLQPKRSVCVIGVLDRVLVVGMSEQGMQTLTEFASDEIPAGINTPPPPDASTGYTLPQGLPFLTYLSHSISRLMGKKKNAAISSETFSDVLERSGMTGEFSHAEASTGKPARRNRKVKPTYA
jgi:flagellar biogenesis protein FliO